MSEEKVMIYLACFPTPNWGPSDVLGFALAEDGTGLLSHLSSSVEWSQHDLGLSSDWQHDVYNKAYPGG